MTGTNDPTNQASNQNINAPEIDTNELINQVALSAADKATAIATEKAQAAAQKVTDDFISKITGGNQPPQRPWNAEKRAPHSYDEVVEVTKSEVDQLVDKKIAAVEAKRQAQSDQQRQEAEKITKQNQEAFNRQIDTLTQEGKLPKPPDELLEKIANGVQLTNEEELNHPYTQARRRIFELASQYREPNLELVYYKYYKPEQSRQPAGAYAPVFGSHKAVEQTPKDDFTYEEIHNAREFSDLLPR